MNKLFFLILIICFATSSCFVEKIQKPEFLRTEEKIINEERVEIKDGNEYIETAKKSTENFHKLYNKQKFNDLFDLIDDKSQFKSDRMAWNLFLNNINNEQGKLESSQFTKASVFKEGTAYEVRIEYRSKFSLESADAQRYELFYWEIHEQGKVTLLNYKNILKEKEID
jgi:hypothetical protein